MTKIKHQRAIGTIFLILSISIKIKASSSTAQTSASSTASQSSGSQSPVPQASSLNNVNKTTEQLHQESRECSQAKADGPEACYQLPICCYFEYYSQEYDAYMKYCVSFAAYVKYTMAYLVQNVSIASQEDNTQSASQNNLRLYLAKLNLSETYSNMDQDNFCKVIPNDPRFPDMRGCSCGTVHYKGGWVLRSVLACLVLIFGLNFFVVGV